MGAMAGPLGARGVRNAPRTFWAPTSGNGRASGNAKTAHFSGNGHSAPENAPAHTAAIPGHRAHCPRAKRAQIFPQTPRGWVLARASVPAQKVRVACAELSATKTIEQWGREVICSKENLQIYHYAHVRNSATRVYASVASDTSQALVRRDARVGPISGSCAPATQACCMPCCMNIKNNIAWHAGKTACTKHASICVCAAGQASSLPGPRRSRPGARLMCVHAACHAA